MAIKSPVHTLKTDQAQVHQHLLVHLVLQLPEHLDDPLLDLLQDALASLVWGSHTLVLDMVLQICLTRAG